LRDTAPLRAARQVNAVVRERSSGVSMGVNEDILAARRFGVVHCGFSSLTAPILADLAGEFGLRNDAGCYREIDEASARLSVRRLLHRDLAYSAEVMPERQAEQLMEEFFAQFSSGATFFTNNWCPATHATFDEGVLGGLPAGPRKRPGQALPGPQGKEATRFD
jgi:hypothetical protein